MKKHILTILFCAANVVVAQTSSVAFLGAGPRTISPSGQLTVKLEVSNTGNSTWSPQSTFDCPTLDLLNQSGCVSYPQQFGHYGLQLLAHPVINGQPDLGRFYLAHLPLGVDLQPGETVVVQRNLFANGLPVGQYVLIAYTVRNWTYAFGSQMMTSPAQTFGLSPKFYFTVASDVTPPITTLTGAIAGTCRLWPPNGQMVSVGSIAASDSGTGLKSLNVSVSTDDVTTTATDSEVQVVSAAEKRVLLRAERAGSNRQGRTYYITVDTEDYAGNRSSVVRTCAVPHDNR